MQDFVNLTSKFNSIVVKTLKPILCFSYDGVPLKFFLTEEEYFITYKSSTTRDPPRPLLGAEVRNILRYWHLFYITSNI